MSSLLPLLAGVLAWTFAEYAIHNWYGHRARGRNAFSREHLRHHAIRDFFGPTHLKVRAAAVALTLLGGAAALVVGPWTSLWFTAGFGIAYTSYEVLHRRLHTHGPRGPYGRWARRHHFHHHFGNPAANHGVTSPIWDWVFRTYENPGVVAVPPKMAMRWLLDPATAEVASGFAGDYCLVRPARRSRSNEMPNDTLSQPAR